MQERIPPFRRLSHSKRPSARRAIWFVMLFFIGVLIVLFFDSDLNKIDQVEIKGNYFVTDNEVRATAGLAEGNDFFRWDVQQAEQALTQLPVVEKVSIERSFPGLIRIHIQEWEMVALWANQEGRFPLLANGSIPGKYPWGNQPFAGPVIKGYSNPEDVQALVEELIKVSAEIRADLLEITPQENEIYTNLLQISSRQGHRIYIQREDLEQKMKLYPRFQNKPEGDLYFLDTTRYVPNKTWDSVEIE